MTLDPDSFRSVMGHFASGVTVVTTRDADERDIGMTVSAFSSVSLEPALVQICIGHDASAYEAISGAEEFAVNILSSEQEVLSRRFAVLESARRFDGLGIVRGESGLVLLDEALAHLECRVVARHVAGDHTIFIGEVQRAGAREARPLLYYRGGYTQLER
jgi:flavin reductase (DIM6/NTAB) family NADH-FMN oxidoreductase RutF